jgi:hypothetical protein
MNLRDIKIKINDILARAASKSHTNEEEYIRAWNLCFEDAFVRKQIDQFLFEPPKESTCKIQIEQVCVCLFSEVRCLCAVRPGGYRLIARLRAFHLRSRTLLTHAHDRFHLFVVFLQQAPNSVAGEKRKHTSKSESVSYV